jgi:hypothetical protein
MKKYTASLFLMLAVGIMSLSSLQAGQPHMESALEHLRAARAELRVAEHNKGGWRVRALEHVERAIADTENGMRAGR